MILVAFPRFALYNAAHKWNSGAVFLGSVGDLEWLNKIVEMYRFFASAIVL
jgi:hypothetical protein